MRSLFAVLAILTSILMPTCFYFAFQYRSKNHTNVDPKRLPIMHPFSLRFWTPKTSLLGSNLEPSWPSVSHQDGPRGVTDPPPKRPPRPNLEPAWFSKSPQDGPGGLPAPPLVPFGLDFGGRGSIFKGFWSPFSSHFYVFWISFFQQP